MEPVSRGSRARRVLLVALVLALPWLWFLVRDRGGPLDAVAVAMPLIGAASVAIGAIVAGLSRRVWPLMASAAVFAVCVVAVLAPRLPRAMAPPRPAIRLAVANVWDENPTPDLARSSLIDRQADVLAAVEMPDDAFYASMSASAAAQGLKFTTEQGRQGVWSRFPVHTLDELSLPKTRVMRVGVDVPGAPFVLYVVHGLNPFRETTFTDQLAFTRDLLAAIATEGRPVVLAGDLNMSDRVASYRAMDGALTDAMRAGAVGASTYMVGWWRALLLRIDHVFLTRAWCAAGPGTFTATGSDHQGVEVAVGPCA